MKSQANIVHRWLGEQEKVFDGRPIWRLVWSENPTEKRKGDFNEFYGDLFIRSFYGIKECRKYNYIHERWILEKWGPGRREEIQPEDDRSGFYEPFFVFEDSKGNFLHPTLKVVQFIIHFARQSTVMTNSEMKRLVELGEEAEVKQFLGQLEDQGRSPIESLLHTREGVSMYVPQDPIKKLLLGEK